MVVFECFSQGKERGRGREGGDQGLKKGAHSGVARNRDEIDNSTRAQ